MPLIKDARRFLIGSGQLPIIGALVRRVRLHRIDGVRIRIEVFRS